MLHSLMVLVFLSLAITAPAEADEPAGEAAKALAPWLDEQAILVIHVDVMRLDVASVFAGLNQVAPDARPMLESVQSIAGTRLTEFIRVGGKEIFVVFSLADLPGGPPSLLIPLSADADEAAIKKLFQWKALEIQSRDGEMLFMGTRAAWDRIKTSKAPDRPELAAAWQAVSGAAVQALLLPTADNRRTIEELLPTLPDEIGGGPSRIVTRGALWAALGVDTSPDISLRLIIQSQDTDSAVALRETWVTAWRWAATHEALRELLSQADEAAKLLTPRVKDDRLVLSLQRADGSLGDFLKVLAPTLLAARQKDQHNESMNHLKQIGLAMHVYHEQHRSFPAPANYSAAGKPLLSWRVHLLPHLGEQELFQQFHLDEPWDSVHNRTLIDRMPDVFRSPSSRVTEKGRTCYVTLTGENTVFPGRQGLPLSKISDGTSNTLLAAEADDDHVVIWTRPDDLPFNPEEPTRGLGNPTEKGFLVLLCDGSVLLVRKAISPATMRSLVSPTDGEIVDLSEERL